MEIGGRIAQYRMARNWTTNRLANESGLSQSFLRSVELGEKGISVENLELICSTLGITLRDFFTISDERDELMEQIERLNQAQKQALSDFLKMML